MGCIYQNREGECTLASDTYGNLTEEMEGSDDGYCVCSDDPSPSDTCGSYESDYTCRECGADLNIEECGCDE